MNWGEDDNLDPIEALGVPKGTPEYSLMEKATKIEKCMERQGVRSCEQCNRVNFCTLVDSYRRELLAYRETRERAKREQEAKAEAAFEEERRTRSSEPGVGSSDASPKSPSKSEANET